MSTTIKLNMNSKLQPEGKTKGNFISIKETTPITIDGNEYPRYKAGFETTEGKNVFTNLVVDTTQESSFMRFLDVIGISVMPNAEGDAELDFKSCVGKQVGLEIEHTTGKSIVFANVTHIFAVKDK